MKLANSRLIEGNTFSLATQLGCGAYYQMCGDPESSKVQSGVGCFGRVQSESSSCRQRGQERQSHEREFNVQRVGESDQLLVGQGGPCLPRGAAVPEMLVWLCLAKYLPPLSSIRA